MKTIGFPSLFQLAIIVYSVVARVFSVYLLETCSCWQVDFKFCLPCYFLQIHYYTKCSFCGCGTCTNSDNLLRMQARIFTGINLCIVMNDSVCVHLRVVFQLQKRVHVIESFIHSLPEGMTVCTIHFSSIRKGTFCL